MVLASMIAMDEDALICDFAETYHIYDYRSLPATLAGIYAAGLRQDARINIKMSGYSAPVDILLLASIADAMHIRVWQQTKDAQHNKNRPESILAKMLETKKPSELEGSDIESFDEWYKSMVMG